jgi:hypothetical protein
MHRCLHQSVKEVCARDRSQDLPTEPKPFVVFFWNSALKWATALSFLISPYSPTAAFYCPPPDIARLRNIRRGSECSNRHINFKASPFNIVRPDVNISFMWAKQNPVRELAGVGSAAGRVKREEVLVKVTFPMKLPYKWYLFGTWLNSSFQPFFPFFLLCGDGSCYVLLSRLAFLADDGVATCDAFNVVECYLNCSITEGKLWTATRLS